MRVRSLFWWLVIPLLLIAAWLGSRSLDDHVIWGDEYHTVYDTGVSMFGPLSPFGIWERVGTRNPWHAPGYFIMLNAWLRLTGSTPPILRAMSLLFGLLTIAWTYRLGSDIASKHIGLYAAGILAASAFYAHFLHEMRVYTLLTFLLVFETWVYLRIVRSRGEPSRMWWTALFVGAAGLLYSHYFAIVPLAAIGLYHLFFVRKNRRWWIVVGVMMLAGVFFLPWFPYLLNGLGLNAERENLHARALNADEALARFGYLFSNGAVVLMAALGLLGVATAYLRRRGAGAIAFLSFALLALLLLANEVLRVMHGGRLRYLIVLWPLFALLMALGIEQLRRWKLAPATALVVWMSIGIWNTVMVNFTDGLDGSLYIYPIHQIARRLDPLYKPGDVVVNYLPDDGLVANWYEKIASFYYAPLHMEYLLVQTNPNPRDWVAIEQKHLLLLQPRDRLWVAYMPTQVSTTREDFEAELGRELIHCEQVYSEPDVTIELYVRSADLCGA